VSAQKGRFLCSFAFVLCVVAGVHLAVTGCRDFGAFVALVIVAAMAIFIGVTLDA
jgi:hypothetical protein